MLIGFAMNAICVFGAMLHGDITISGAQSFNVGLFILAFFAVLIQASQEELESRVFFFGKLKEGGFSFGAAVILSSSFFYNTDFGVEGSIWCIIVHIVVDGILLVLIKKKKQI